MGAWGRVGLVMALLVLAAPTSAVAASFGAAVFTPVVGAAYAVGDVAGIAPVRGATALTLTRAADASSPRLLAARAGGARFKTISVAWTGPGGVQSICLQDVAVTSYATRAPGGAGGGAIEHSTLFFAAAAQAAGTAACSRLPPAPPILVRLFIDVGGGLNVRLDCLLARCAGALRLGCPVAVCPAGGLGRTAFALGPGQERVIHVPGTRRLRGRHPRLQVVVALTGRTAPIVAGVTVDPPLPVGLPVVATTVVSPSVSPAPPGTSAAPSPSPVPSAPAGDTGPILGVPTGPAPPPVGGTKVATTLSLTCAGPAGAFTAVDGVLGPALAGASIAIAYQPADAHGEPLTDFLTSGAGGQFHDAPDASFKSATASFAGSSTQLASHASCP